MEKNTILLASLAFIGWGFGDLFATLNSRALGTLSAGLWRVLLSILFYTALLPVFSPSFSAVSPTTIGLLIIIAVVGSAGTLAFYEGLRRGNAAIVGTIASSFGVLVVLFSILFFGERPNPFALIGTGTIIIGVVLASVDLNQLRRRVFSDPGVPWALAAMIFWGIFFTVIRFPSTAVGPLLTSYGVTLTFCVVLIVLLFIRRERFVLRHTVSRWLFIVAQGITITLAEISYNSAVTKGLVSLVAPVASAYPILFVTLSFIFLKEKLSRQQCLGVVLALGGIVTLAFFG